MNLVGYLYEAYHDARSVEHKVKQIRNLTREVLVDQMLRKFPI